MLVDKRLVEKKMADAHLRALIDSSTDNIVSMDIQRVITDCNPAFLRQFGYDREEVIGQSVRFIHPNEESFNRFGQEVYPIVKEEGAWRGEWVYMSRAGDIFPTETTVSTIKNSDGPSRGYVVIIRDISERKLMEAQLRHSQKMEALGSLASGIAHDFNNVLQAISGYVQLINNKIDRNRPFREYLDAVDTAADRASSLVQQLLTFSRKLEPNLKPMDLNQEVERAVRMLSRTIPKMIAIEFYPADDPGLVSADAAQIEQVLLNLGTNARDAMPEGGRLIFDTKQVTLGREYIKEHLEFKPGRYMRIAVTDTGQGMDRETLEHIFEPFYTTKGSDRGTGLGLSMVYGIVKGHDGGIFCYSEPGKGTTFKIYLPVLEGPEAHLAIDTLENVRAPGGDETILLVDDDQELLGIAREMLEDHGYGTLVAASGEEALAIYQERADDIDLILLDFGMPGMGGHKALETLLKMNPLAKVVIVSGYSLNGRISETMKVGAKAYIGKPYRLSAMMETVRGVLDQD